MRRLIEGYQDYIQQLHDRFAEGDSYFHKYSGKNQVYEEIKQEETQIKIMVKQLQQKMNITKKIIRQKNDPIANHPLFQSQTIKQVVVQHHELCSKWLQYIKINQEINIAITIEEIVPIVRDGAAGKLEIKFDSLKFHVHHCDKKYSSQEIQYQPGRGMYHINDVIDGRVLKPNRQVSLKIKHQIRIKNYSLYHYLFQQLPIYIVAESSYGLVLGVASLRLDQIMEENKSIRDIFRCILFKNYAFDNRIHEETSTNNILAKIRITIQSHQISPLVDQLNHNLVIRLQDRKQNASNSPKRKISKSPAARSLSPKIKIKRQLISELVKPNNLVEKLTIFENWSYRHLLKQFSRTQSKELVYQQIKNIEQKNIQLIKVEENYYLKCWLIKRNKEGQSYINFTFNGQEYIIYAMTNELYQILDYQNYAKISKDDKNRVSLNKLVQLSNNVLVYPKQTTRILKNFIKQTITDSLLNSIFIKTAFADCQIFVNSPFVLTEIVHNQTGYMIYYCHQDKKSINRQCQTQLVFFFKSKFKSIIEIHMFDCVIEPKSYGRETIYLEQEVFKDVQIYSLPMSTITNQNNQYTIRSLSHQVNVVNGQAFKFDSKYNSQLIIQVIDPVQQSTRAELLFFDNKFRSFLLVLYLIEK